ncbi:Hypothetical protein HDN1F_13000 [gamma proteobacterium HdN1]|nr:Hypothetical protein HDN1F_13000 [gamma proteobacterium HdN1]
MSQARVAAAAGVRQSHLTYYYPSRADLIKATVYAIRTQMLSAIQTALHVSDVENPSNESPPSNRSIPAQNFQERLRSFCLQEVCDLPKARMLLSIMVVAEEEKSLHPWIDEFHAESISQWQAIYRALGIHATDDDVMLFHSTFVGAALLGAQTGSTAALQRARRVTELALDRLLNRQIGNEDQAGRENKPSKDQQQSASRAPAAHLGG